MTTDRQAEPGPPHKGIYANYFEVGHTAFEIVIDFGQRYGTRETPCHTRIVMSPIYAQALLETLRDSLEQFVTEFGPVPDVGPGGSEDDDGRASGGDGAAADSTPRSDEE
jgi:hypothetical protein